MQTSSSRVSAQQAANPRRVLARVVATHALPGRQGQASEPVPATRGRAALRVMQVKRELRLAAALLAVATAACRAQAVAKVGTRAAAQAAAVAAQAA